MLRRRISRNGACRGGEKARSRWKFTRLTPAGWIISRRMSKDNSNIHVQPVSTWGIRYLPVLLMCASLCFAQKNELHRWIIQDSSLQQDIARQVIQKINKQL